MNDIAAWLETLDLGKYAGAFAENEIDFKVLPQLTEEDIRELGLPLGPRRKLLTAIAALKGGSGGKDIQQPPDPAATSEPPPESRAERRQLTVMFVDLVGSTALSGQLDPEDLRELILGYQNTVAGEITRFEGHVAKYMGDGVLAYFGWPRAHEDEAERAVRAALAVTAAVKKLRTPDGMALATRVGIATGLVIVGDLIGEGAAQEEAVVGETPNLAARLQSIAGPNEVVLADSTRRLVEGWFELKPLGPRSLKGISKPVNAYRAMGVKQRTRFEVASSGGVSLLLGRDEELGMLLQRWKLAKAGEGQVLLLGGEAGIGKSRLAEALRERIRAEPHTLLRYQCSPYHMNSAFHPIITQIERTAGFEQKDGTHEKLDKLEALFGNIADKHWLLAALLSLPTDRYNTVALTPEKRKAETISILVQYLASLARTSAVLVILEDVHWIDHSTRELFDAVTDEVSRMRVLVVITHRPGFDSSWTDKAHVTQLMLDRLGHRDANSLVKSVAGAAVLPSEVVRQILQKTDGVPLFVEELTKAVIDSGLTERDSRHQPILKPDIPSTIHDSLASRLDRAGRAKEIAQVAATIGREFSYALIASVADHGEKTLSEDLEQLEASGLVLRRGVPPEAFYTFKHALVRDAAYATMLREHRQEMHRRVADVMRRYQQAMVQKQPEVLAHHLTEAGEFDAALEQWLLAGQLAFSRSAAIEAQAHLERGLALIAPNAVGDEHARQELAFCVALGPVYMTTKGAFAQEVEQVYLRARELSAQVGDPGTQFKALWGQWHAKQVSGALNVAARLAKECLSLSRQLRDEGCELQAHHASWSTEFFRGEFVSCLEHANEGWRLYDLQRHADHRFGYGGHDPGACSRYFGGMSHWFLGRSAQATTCAAQSMEVARSINHPFSLVVTLLYTAYVAYFRRDHGEARRLAQEGLNICEEQGFPTWLPGLAQLRDWALVVEESDADALARMGERISPASVAGQLLPANVMFLVDACVHLGEYGQGIPAVVTGLQLAKTLDQRWIFSELHRLHAKLLMRGGADSPDEAKDKLNLSLQLARQQNARSIEMRSVIDLARLHLRAGEAQEAGRVFNPVYRTFTEGFDAVDLKDAKALLDELA